MNLISIKEVLDIKSKEVDQLKLIQAKYPDVSVYYDWSGPIYTTSTVNKLVDRFETKVYGIYSFFLIDNDGLKIHADPHCIKIKSNYEEAEWLTYAISFNPRLLVKLMREIKSSYIYSLSYHSKRFPELPNWIEKYQE